MMLVDCETCPVRELRCADCMVTALGAMRRDGRAAPDGVPATRMEVADRLPLDPAERRAVSVLMAAGLVDRRAAESLTAVREPARSIRLTPAHRRAVG